MQEAPYPQHVPADPQPKKRAFRLPRRKMTWALTLWTTIMGIWVIAGTGQADGIPAQCKPGGAAYDSTGIFTQQDCNTFSDAGTAIGVGLIIGLWFIGFVALSLVWFMTRPKEQS